MSEHAIAPPRSGFVLVSHFPRDHDKGPCASVHAALIGDQRVADLSGYVSVEWPLDEMLREIDRVRADGECRVLFNGLTSMLDPAAQELMDELLGSGVGVTCYWHETSWNLRLLAGRAADRFATLTALLPMLEAEHWVTTPHARHPIALVLGEPLERIRCVYETTDLTAFRPPEHVRDPDRPLVIGGAGLPIARKGVDRFERLAGEIPELAGRPTEFRWWAATEKNVMPAGTDARSSPVRWMGHDDDFASVLQTCDALLMTSRDDPFPLVALQALATGVPVFCFDTVGTAEVLPPQLVATDVAEMADRLRSHMASPTLDRAQLRGIAEQFSPERFWERAQRPIPSLSRDSMLPNAELVEDGTGLEGRALAHARRQLVAARRGNESLERLQREVKDLRALRERDRAMLRRSRRALRQRGAPGGPTRSVVVVGAAPGLLDQKLGEKIDECDVVVRVNNFVTDGFESHVGSRTTHAFISFATKPNPTLHELPRQNVHLFIGDDRSIDQARARMARADGTGLDPSDIDTLDRTKFVDAVTSLVDPAPGCWPTTGMAAIQWAVDRFGRNATIYVCGFTFYSESDSRPGRELVRYDGSTTVADGKHDFPAERRRLAAMIGAGEIVELEEGTTVPTAPNQTAAAVTQVAARGRSLVRRTIRRVSP